jgi:hypothetical protein
MASKTFSDRASVYLFFCLSAADLARAGGRAVVSNFFFLFLPYYPLSPTPPNSRQGNRKIEKQINEHGSMFGAWMVATLELGNLMEGKGNDRA